MFVSFVKDTMILLLFKMNNPGCIYMYYKVIYNTSSNHIVLCIKLIPEIEHFIFYFLKL